MREDKEAGFGRESKREPVVRGALARWMDFVRLV